MTYPIPTASPLAIWNHRRRRRRRRHRLHLPRRLVNLPVKLQRVQPRKVLPTNVTDELLLAGVQRHVHVQIALRYVTAIADLFEELKGVRRLSFEKEGGDSPSRQRVDHSGGF